MNSKIPQDFDEKKSESQSDDRQTGRDMTNARETDSGETD